MEEIALEQKRIRALNEFILKNSLQIFMPYYNKTDDEMVISKDISIDRNGIINIYINTILSVIASDEFEDGEISNSERYMKNNKYICKMHKNNETKFNELQTTWN